MRYTKYIRVISDQKWKLYSYRMTKSGHSSMYEYHAICENVFQEKVHSMANAMWWVINLKSGQKIPNLLVITVRLVYCPVFADILTCGDVKKRK